MDTTDAYVIKSFKHDGHLHRMWMENWPVPVESLCSAHAEGKLLAFVNCQTKIREADGREWVSRIPGVSFFLPNRWYNVVALIEEEGIRYYCNLASPYYVNNRVLTYIDYDLDVILTAAGDVHILDQDEYERHRKQYHYSAVVETKVQAGLSELLELISRREAPFQDHCVRQYYNEWLQWQRRGQYEP